MEPLRGGWQREADVVVVGSGAAGISVALTAAARGLRVLVVTKDLVGGATPLAQGGLAAALGAGDTPAAHGADTLVAGAGLCAPDVVAALAESAPGAIGWLSGLGARLETRDLRLEGGHSARRIVHSGDDATGAEVHRALLAALLASGIEILDRTVALDLLLSDTPPSDTQADIGADECSGTGTRGRRSGSEGGIDRAGIRTGARATIGTAAANADPAGVPERELVPARPVQGADQAISPEAVTGLAAATIGADGSLTPGVIQAASSQTVTGLAAATIGADGLLVPGVIAARAVVIAAGGLGQAFGTTSNPAGATGDGIALAARAGAVLRDLEFVQFHPTVLWLPGASGQCPLVTEALRGAGAVLRDSGGTPLMAGHDPRGDLAPRDVVAARMAEVIAAGNAGHVWLDATELGRELLEDGFPTVTAACRKHGIDPVRAMIPVAPGAHYSCGGILADLDGRTTIPGLYAAGEAASTGVQGANRLASNSVTEAIIAGRRTGEAIASTRPGGASSPGTAPGPYPGAPAASGNGTRPDHGTASDGRAVDQHRGSNRETAPASDGKITFYRVSSPSFFRRFDDRGSSAADIAASDPQSRLERGEVGRGEVGRGELAQAMSRYAGVLRDADGLGQLAQIIATAGPTLEWNADLALGAPSWLASAEATGSASGPARHAGGDSAEPGTREADQAGTSQPGTDHAEMVAWEGLDLAAVEAANLRTVSLLIAVGAMRRAESRGCHRRRDATETAAVPWHTLARWDGRELLLAEQAL